MTDTDLDLEIDAVAQLAAELDDAAYARLSACEPPRSPQEARFLELNERLLVRLSDLPGVEPAPGWEERAVARWQREMADLNALRERERAG